MLSSQQNDVITRTGQGEPCGELMRRYWQPVALAAELSQGGPAPVRILGEDLVLFRDNDGHPGLVGRRCPHRGADLSYGRVEDGGLRCIYHGWLFARDGSCLAQPGEPEGRDFCDRIQQTAYPCREVGGLILAYMGPGDPPALPALPFFEAADDPRIWCTKMHHDCNYLQANEGNVDPQHLSYLHRFIADDAAILPELNRMLAADAAPELNVRETGFGLEVLAIRTLPGGDRYVRITNFIMPNASAFEGVPLADAAAEPVGENMGYQMHWHVPIDDHSHWKYTILFRYSGEIDRRWQSEQHANIDTDFHTAANRDNRFLQDRDEMRSQSFAGMGRKYYDHDKFATESQGLIADRTDEHLGFSDKAIIAMRRQMFRAIRDMEGGAEPMLARPQGRNPLLDMIVRSGRVAPDSPLEGEWWSPASVTAGSLHD